MTDSLAVLKRPLQIAAVVLALIGLVSCARAASGMGQTGAWFLLLSAAAVFASWAVTAPPPREREGMLDGVLDDIQTRLTETELERQERQIREVRDLFRPD